MANALLSEQLGAVLITGGSGFVGNRLVTSFLEDPRWSSVHVVSRNPTVRNETASYHPADITDYDAIRTLLSQIKPRVIIHSAAPSYTSAESELNHVIITGTRTLLQCARNEESVEAFVYTSSDNVIANKNESPLTEDTAKLLQATSKTIMPYGRAKAQADALVLQSNSASLKTCVLRICGTYGEEDTAGVVYSMMKQLQDGQQKIQFGDNKELLEFNYVGNVVHAHCLAAEALLRDPHDTAYKGKCDGEAFFITDDNPIRLWDFAHRVWAEAGHQSPEDTPTIVPFWVMIIAANVLEWIYWFLRKNDPPMRKVDFQYLQQGFMFKIDKAKQRLGYQPKYFQDEGVRRTVEWVLNQG
jgi:sterol-4alpha-carboxylate 3-dehydrogenase (decarboxylating)